MGIVTKTIGTAGRDYSLLQSWEDALPANFVTDGNSQVGECYNDSEFTGTTQLLNVAGETTSATFTLTLKAASGQSFYDNANKLTNRLTYVAANGVGIRSSVSYSSVIASNVSNFIMDGLQVKSSTTNSQAVAADNSPLIKSCILFAAISTQTANLGQANAKVVNSLVINDGSGKAVNLTFGGLVIASTLVRPSNRSAGSSPTATAYGTATVKDCAIFGFGAVTGTYNADGHNVTDTATVPGSTSNLTSKTYANQFVNSSTASGLEDFRVKAGADLIGAGIRDAANTNDIDILGQARSTSAPTVGAMEFIASGIALNATGTTKNNGAAVLSTSIALAATGTTKNSGAASLSTAIAFAATGTTSNSGQAALSTSIALAATGTTANSGAASLSTSVGLTATGTTTNSGAAVLSTSIALAATGTTANSATAALTVGSVWQSTGTTTNSGTAALSTAIALSATGTTRNAGVAALTVGIQLAATGTTTNSGVAALSTSVTLAAAGVTKNNGSASLDVGGVWASIGTTRNSAAANLSTAIALAAIGKAICSSSATLSTAIALASQAITRCSGSASLSTGYPFTVGQISITTKMIQKVVRDFILGLTLDPTTNQPQRVVVAPVNRAAMPKPPFVIITPGKINPLATNTHEQVNANLKNVKRSSQFDCQIDCYGPGSGDLADKISILFRDQYAVDVFAASGIDVTPLYASDATQMPLIDGEAQYEERWKIELSMQFNPIVPVAQQSANMLDVGIISVDATYPP